MQMEPTTMIDTKATWLRCDHEGCNRLARWCASIGMGAGVALCCQRHMKELQEAHPSAGIWRYFPRMNDEIARWKTYLD